MTIAQRLKSPVLQSALVAVAVLAAYANTFTVPFVFDDVAAVTQNPSIEHLTTALNPPAGLSVTGRPIVNLSLALNYAISGREVWSYHVVNLALHLTCALTLLGLLRRTLAQPATGSGSAIAKPETIALVTTLLWALHPLQTAAVTYVMQRSEVLVSLCYVFTLYAFVRGMGSPRTIETAPTRAQAGWLLLSVIACGCGMATKEVMVSAPLLVLLYDRLFLAGSFRAALRQQAAYYGGLAGSWAVLAALVLGSDNRGASAGFDAGVAWTGYALTQLFAVAHYLRLAIWPSPLVFDYGTSLVERPVLWLMGGTTVAALLAATVLALRRWPRARFCGVAFFALLAPSSSVVPIATQTIAEHRVYLALAAPLSIIVIAAYRWCGPRHRWIAVPLIVLCAAGTFGRNRDYASVLRLWQVTVEQRPQNARAHYNCGLALWELGDLGPARHHFASTVELDPRHLPARKRLAKLLMQEGRAAEALEHLKAILAMEPSSAAANYDVAVPLIMLGRPAEALPFFAASIRLDPTQPMVRYNFGKALAELGRYPEALAEFDEACRLDPNNASARNNATRIREYLRR